MGNVMYQCVGKRKWNSTELILSEPDQNSHSDSESETDDDELVAAFDERMWRPKTDTDITRLDRVSDEINDSNISNPTTLTKESSKAQIILQPDASTTYKFRHFPSSEDENLVEWGTNIELGNDTNGDLCQGGSLGFSDHSGTAPGGPGSDPFMLGNDGGIAVINVESISTKTGAWVPNRVPDSWNVR